jgi:hypothetical protein
MARGVAARAAARGAGGRTTPDATPAVAKRLKMLALGGRRPRSLRPWHSARRSAKLGFLGAAASGSGAVQPVFLARRLATSMAEIEDNVDRELFRNVEKLRQLRIEHRDLDEVISRLSLDLHINELQLKRLKKRKLMLKDQIARLESQLIPDLNA